MLSPNLGEQKPAPNYATTLKSAYSKHFKIHIYSSWRFALFIFAEFQIKLLRSSECLWSATALCWSEVTRKKFIYCSTSTCWQIHLFICHAVSCTHSSLPALLTLFSTSSVTRLIFSLVSSVKMFSWFRTKSSLSFWSSRSSIESTLTEQKGNYQQVFSQKWSMYH